MSRRVERIGSLIRTILAEAIQTRLNVPRIPPVTSITRVEVSADLSVARVFVSVLAPEPKQELCLRALCSSAGHLRWLLGRELTLRKTPALDFRLDQSLKRGFETCQLIDRLAQERPGTAEPPDVEDQADAAAQECAPDSAAPQAVEGPVAANSGDIQEDA